VIHYFLLQAVPDLIRKFIEVMITQGGDGHEVEISGIPGASSVPTDRPIPRGQEPPGPPLSSRIIKTANAFDDLVGSSLVLGRAAAAVQQLRLDTVSEYDPNAVEALSRVVNRRSVIQL